MEDYDTEGLGVWGDAQIGNAANFMEANMSSYIRIIKANAELRYEKYAALLDAGFTNEEALTILLKTPIMG